MTIFYTSDLHLGHSNIIKYCNRPFRDAGHMDAVIIANWNSIVTNNDTIYCLGDFSFGNHAPYLSRLNGKKILIKGNHDKNPSITDGWDEVHSYLEIRDAGKHITLCHYKMEVFNKSHHGSLQFYGHSHGQLPGNDQQTDVGVDAWEFFPVPLQDIERRLKISKPYRQTDFHGK